ncbi:TPA: peptidylprolyl isomerase [Candidatus Sumerlaeota bacterium]|jgi:peptidyl-prolyl cis-trans isomerase A (cyclophilin A)|nr:peptidylprolyl isomerase [Candidatus Sumerlaeota bacterium]
MSENLSKGVYALFETSLGNFTAQLFLDKTPQTAQNFIDLAEGKKEHADPETGKMVATRLFDGRKIFRILDGFMFQTGSANDTNMYRAGFSVPDEICRDLTFTKAGLLAMANAGPNTASCQFFVTLGEAAFLNGGYTIFGEVVQGLDVVQKIGKVPTKVSPQNPRDGASLPVEMPVITKVAIQTVE